MTRAEKHKRWEDMRAYKAQGHTMQEVADKFGMAKHSAQQICKGIAPQKPVITPANKGVLKDDDNVALFISERMPEFEYVGNYTGCDGRADIKCINCGTVINRSMISIRKRHCSCPVCVKNTLERNKQKKRQQQTINEQIKKAERFSRTQLIGMRVCVECGALFIPINKNNIRCSPECIRKANNRSSDARLNQNNIVDKDITLTRLFNRDNGQCWLCGKRCDYSDKEVRDGGTVVVGYNYPSIDHVIPLAEGGLHSWGNVRLAHWRCNSLKRDKII